MGVEWEISKSWLAMGGGLFDRRPGALATRHSTAVAARYRAHPSCVDRSRLGRQRGRRNRGYYLAFDPRTPYPTMSLDRVSQTGPKATSLGIRQWLRGGLATTRSRLRQKLGQCKMPLCLRTYPPQVHAPNRKTLQVGRSKT